LLEVNHLVVYHGYVQALKNVSFQVREGELLAILGANGAGKSTLLGTIAGLYKPLSGEVLFKGRPITGQNPETTVRQGISLIPENRQIFGNLSVLDNLLLGSFHRYRKDKQHLKSDIQRILGLFPALKGREKDPAATLSGGLQQMLAIGRGLMANPSLLLLDEPSIGLAPLVVKEIMSILRELKETGVTIILVEQNTKAALREADSVLVLERGRVSYSAASAEGISAALLQEAYLGKSVNPQ